VFKNLRLFAPDAYDFILSKLERNSAKDRDDADHIFKTKKLSSQILRERYEKELRPYLSKENWHGRESASFHTFRRFRESIPQMWREPRLSILRVGRARDISGRYGKQLLNNGWSWVRTSD